MQIFVRSPTTIRSTKIKMSFKPQVYIKLNLAVILAIRRDEMLLEMSFYYYFLLFQVTVLEPT